MEDIGLTISIIALDGDALNTPIKSQRLSELIKKRPNKVVCFLFVYFLFVYKKQTLNIQAHLKVNGQGDICYTNINQKIKSWNIYSDFRQPRLQSKKCE